MSKIEKFSFGKNWQKFLKSLNEERIENAKSSIIEFLGITHLQQKTFLDIGCGSGLFSYAAYLLNAKHIVSFDVDPYSVVSCKLLHKKVNSPKNWEICNGSILDKNFYLKLGKFDIVYSWGVLHHTGNMWQAIKNAADIVMNGGYFYFAIYNKLKGIKGSNFWLRIKKLYNKIPKFLKISLEIIYILNDFVGLIIKFQNPFKFISDYKRKRGMNYRIDVCDWLGGFPYEYASIDEVLGFMKSKFPNFKIINIKCTNDLGNNWFLFKKT